MADTRCTNTTPKAQPLTEQPSRVATRLKFERTRACDDCGTAGSGRATDECAGLRQLVLADAVAKVEEAGFDTRFSGTCQTYVVRCGRPPVK